MKYLIFSSIVGLCIAYYLKLSHIRAIEAKADDAYWERERKASFTRKKPLDDLDYITIPPEILQMHPKSITSELQSILNNLNDLSSYKIVNLTGYSNTDLKLKYGTANITILSDYDFHYTNLVTLLQKLAEKLHENGEDALAAQTLEFAISTGTDVSKSYYLLADLYCDAGTAWKIQSLIDSAQNIHTIQKDTIIETLQTQQQNATLSQSEGF